MLRLLRLQQSCGVEQRVNQPKLHLRKIRPGEAVVTWPDGSGAAKQHSSNAGDAQPSNCVVGTSAA
jgi:hypothetical protein